MVSNVRFYSFKNFISIKLHHFGFVNVFGIVGVLFYYRKRLFMGSLLYALVSYFLWIFRIGYPSKSNITNRIFVDVIHIQDSNVNDNQMVK